MCPGGVLQVRRAHDSDQVNHKEVLFHFWLLFFPASCFHRLCDDNNAKRL